MPGTPDEGSEANECCCCQSNTLLWPSPLYFAAVVYFFFFQHLISEIARSIVNKLFQMLDDDQNL